MALDMNFDLAKEVVERVRRRSSMFDVDAAATEGRKRGESAVFTSQAEFHAPKPKKQMENTYQLELPQLFNPCQARKILREELDTGLQDVKKYEPDVCRTKSVQIATKIRNGLKALGYKRYRYVVNVHVGQSKGTSLMVGTRFVWDSERDTWASHSFKNAYVFGVAEVYCVSME